jgi:hypothetical protein
MSEENIKEVADTESKEDNKIEKEFALYKEYKLKYPIKRGTKVIKTLTIEVPTGNQLLALEGKDKIYEVIASIVSMCSKDDKFTVNEVLDFKSPDLNALIEVLEDFLQ